MDDINHHVSLLVVISLAIGNVAYVLFSVLRRFVIRRRAAKDALIHASDLRKYNMAAFRGTKSSDSRRS